MMITLTYANGVTRHLSVTHTRHEENNTAVITTAEEGDICISQSDMPDAWAQLPPAPEPEPEPEE